MNILSKVKEYIEKNLIEGGKFKFFYNLGIDSYSKKDYQNALKFFINAAEQPESKSEVYYNLGLTYQCIKDYENAIEAYDKFLNENPQDYDAIYNLGLTYFLKEDFSNAAKSFEKCLKVRLEEDSTKALALAYLSLGEAQKAIEFADKIFYEENGLQLYYSIAKVFENKNSLTKDFTYIDKAIEMHKKIIEADSNYFDSYLSASICYAKKGDWENSVEFCKKALDVNPKSYEANNQMGLIYYCCEEIAESIKYYETALKINPSSDYKIYSNLGYAYEKIGHYDKAVNVFSKLVNKFPQFPAKEEIKNHLRILKTL